MNFIDLGLPSGTLWAESNEEGFYEFGKAFAEYGKSLPTKEQFEELQTQCHWEWKGSGYEVTGPNGNSITLPAAGYRNCDGVVNYVGSCGCYLSSTPRDLNYAWSLNAFSDIVFMGGCARCYGGTVRLVKR